MPTLIRRLVNNTRGVTAIEYGLIAALDHAGRRRYHGNGRDQSDQHLQPSRRKSVTTGTLAGRTTGRKLVALVFSAATVYPLPAAAAARPRAEGAPGA